MDIKIAQNIRQLRKERKMTQEQLAEAFGVSIGAVSKWEAGQSVPDISIIMEMAEYFETSVDVLLGYEWKKGTLGRCLETIKQLRNEKRFEEASSEAEKALLKYPNSFKLTYACGILYSMAGVESHSKADYQRALQLYERSLELIGQNKDPKISEWTIQNAIADAYLGMGKPELALEKMKQNNAGGTENAAIGFLLACNLKEAKEALSYLSDALVKIICELPQYAQAYAEAYSMLGRPKDAVEVYRWFFSLLDGLRKPKKITHLDKECVEMLIGLSVAQVRNNETKEAKENLLKAYRMAKAFDQEPRADFIDMKFYHSSMPWTAFDDFGDSAVEGIQKALEQETTDKEVLFRLWNEVKTEE